MSQGRNFISPSIYKIFDCNIEQRISRRQSRQLAELAIYASVCESRIPRVRRDARWSKLSYKVLVPGSRVEGAKTRRRLQYESAVDYLQ